MLDQLVDAWRRLWVGEESIDLVVAPKSAGLLAYEYGARGDWLGERGDAVEGIAVRRASRSNLSAPSFEKYLTVLDESFAAPTERRA